MALLLFRSLFFFKFWEKSRASDVMNSCDLSSSGNCNSMLEFAIYAFCKFLQIMAEVVMTMYCTVTIYCNLLLCWLGSKSHFLCRMTWNFSLFNMPPGKPVDFCSAKLSSSTFKFLSKIQSDTISHPEVYLDLGNEFCLDCSQIQAIHIRLTGYLLCGKHRIVLTTQVISPAKKVEGNKQTEIV